MGDAKAKLVMSYVCHVMNGISVMSCHGPLNPIQPGLSDHGPGLLIRNFGIPTGGELIEIFVPKFGNWFSSLFPKWELIPTEIPIAHWDKTQLYWYFSNLCEDRKKICKRVQHNISIITACDIQVIGVRPRGFLY